MAQHIKRGTRSLDLAEEEWKGLRDEAIELAKETRTIEQLVVGATGGVYAWLATDGAPVGGIDIAPWFIPVLFVVAGAFRCWSMGQHIRHMSAYLRDVEKEIAGGPRWEGYFAKRRGYLHFSAVVFWLAMLVATIEIPVFLKQYGFPREAVEECTSKVESEDDQMLRQGSEG